jgi:hypothetical protein
MRSQHPFSRWDLCFTISFIIFVLYRCYLCNLLELIEKHEHWQQRQEHMSIGNNAKNTWALATTPRKHEHWQQRQENMSIGHNAKKTWALATTPRKHKHWPQRQENMSIGHNAKKYSYDKTKVSYPKIMKYKNTTLSEQSKIPHCRNNPKSRKNKAYHTVGTIQNNQLSKS